MDPFQWKEISSKASQDLAYRVLIGPLYPTDQREEITVVLFNEATLKYLGATWPTALGVHAEILNAIREMGPRAVMVDFIFPDHRNDPTVTDLQEAIRAFKEPTYIPLYFARAEGANLDWIRPDLSEASLASVTKPLSDGVSRTYEPCSIFSADKPICACVSGPNEFEACPADTRAGSPRSPVAMTAAFELFDRDRLPDWFDVRRPVPMEVVWSNRLNPINDLWMRRQTPSGLERLCVDLSTGIVDWFRRVFFTSEQHSFRQTCPYTTTVTAHGLLQALEDPRLREIIHRKFVFYGGDLTGLEDTVVPPTHVKLPGVYLHAMALDNLLTFDGYYKRSSFTGLGLDLGANYFNAAVAVLLALIVVAYARSGMVMNAEQTELKDNTQRVAYLFYLWRRWILWICFNLGMLTAIIAICLALYLWLAISPKNWLGYWGLSLALSGMAKGRVVESFATSLGTRLVPSLERFFFHGGANMRNVILAAALLGLSVSGGALAQTAQPTTIIGLNLVPLPTFEAASVESKRSDLDESALAGQALPWSILEVSDNSMYLVEFKSKRVWVIDSTVKVDAKAKASAFAPEATNLADPDLASTRGYGN
jgi:hypothetical protein